MVTTPLYTMLYIKINDAIVYRPLPDCLTLTIWEWPEDVCRA